MSEKQQQHQQQQQQQPPQQHHHQPITEGNQLMQSNYFKPTLLDFNQSSSSEIGFVINSQNAFYRSNLITVVTKKCFA
jgi:hypothetical protein